MRRYGQTQVPQEVQKPPPHWLLDVQEVTSLHSTGLWRHGYRRASQPAHVRVVEPQVTDWLETLLLQGAEPEQATMYWEPLQSRRAEQVVVVGQ